MKIVTVVGARPQFIKAAAVSRELRKTHTEALIHTGQHYDANMSAHFFDELGIPEPDYNLDVGSGSHGHQTGAMLARLEDVFMAESPNWALVYGDTNSTLAGALAATKLHIPVAHVEAGLRSFNRRMPEEVNRVLTDHAADLLLCPSQTAVENLRREGVTRGVRLVGDVMYDAWLYAAQQSGNAPALLNAYPLEPGAYLLVTIHRAENTDDESRLRSILTAFESLDEPLIWPLHPRTRKTLTRLGYTPPPHVRLIEPVGYFEMTTLERCARMILTDSGGIQKEAYWASVPCITLRDETEWVETVAAGWNVVVGADTQQIIDAVQSFVTPDQHPSLYGDGQTASRIVEALESMEIAS